MMKITSYWFHLSYLYGFKGTRWAENVHFTKITLCVTSLFRCRRQERKEAMQSEQSEKNYHVTHQTHQTHQIHYAHPFLLMDRSTQPLSGDALFPFALEDLLCKQVGLTGMPVLHMWRHNRAMILGLRDRRLPYAQQAMEWLQEQGYAVGVRHSGGAAVPLDQGVLNVSFILPKSPGETDFHRDFSRMIFMLEGALGNLGISFNSGEIQRSYCPGDYDLSVRGRKFCGIAQRRQLRAFVIQAFLIVEGEGSSRGELARAFYDRALGDKTPSTDSNTPDVDPQVMTSLAEVTGGITIKKVAEAVKSWTKAEAGIDAVVQKDDEWNNYFTDAAPIDWQVEAEKLSAPIASSLQ